MTINTEHTGLMEEMMPRESNSRLDDIVLELSQKSAALSSSIHETIKQDIVKLVRPMNCYYSNLIEDHPTSPIDIDRALKKDFSDNKEQRNLQEEAIAHIHVQELIDNDNDLKKHPLSLDYTLWLHKEFCRLLPKDLLMLKNKDTEEIIEVIPGKLRDGYVKVGRHIPPQPENILSFMQRFEEAYSPNILGKHRQVIASACSHHRFLWIHPFYDGNGRVARLMSYSALRRLGIGSGLWSIARGLARDVEQYKSLLQNADNARRGDRDGRGSLSEKALLDFSEFFLKSCIDQVDYMSSILNLKELSNRINIYAKEEVEIGRLPKGSDLLLKDVLIYGEVARGEVPRITGYKERSARAIVSKLLKQGLLQSDTPKSNLRIAYPIHIIDRYFPGLYPASALKDKKIDQ